jgi:hypothetical protein
MDQAAQTIPAFLQYGAMGILALGFVVLLVLFVKADKRASVYAASLKEASFDRSQLIAVVSDNTRAITAMTGQIEALIKSQDKAGTIMDKFDRRLDSDRCPFLSGEH